MLSDELLATFRTELYDQAPKDPQLWSDGEIYGYMDEAQKQFCRWTGGIGDASSALTRLSVASVTTTVSVGPPPVTLTVAATDIPVLSPLILRVRDAWRSTDGRPVDVVNYEDLPSHGIRFNGRTAVWPEVVVIGMEPGTVKLYPAPKSTSVGFIQLLVDRLPLRSITDEGQKFEIAEQHHINLLMWMKHRAYSKQDADTFDAKKSNDFRDEFKAYCADAKQEKERAKSKVRIVQYGGIGGAGGNYHGRNGYGRGSCRY